MIKANELRIGNLLIDPLTKCYLRVSELTEEGKIVSTVIDRSKFPLPAGWSTQPIPLTSEILERCGFHKNNMEGVPDNWYNQGTITLEFKNEAFWFTDNLSQISNIELKHLHQLQNILFAICGDEISFTWN